MWLILAHFIRVVIEQIDRRNHALIFKPFVRRSLTG